MAYTPLPDLAGLSLTEIAELGVARKLPPVAQWDPQETEHSRMRIAADGTWFHDGSPIARHAMVRAFASLLRREVDGRYFLVTPHYKQEIEVEDAAFLAIDCRRVDDALVFRLNVEEDVVAGPDHPIRAEGDAETPAVYILARNGCEARVDRSTWLQLVDLAASDSGTPTVTSRGETFSLVPE